MGGCWRTGVQCKRVVCGGKGSPDPGGSVYL